MYICHETSELHVLHLKKSEAPTKVNFSPAKVHVPVRHLQCSEIAENTALFLPQRLKSWSHIEMRIPNDPRLEEKKLVHNGAVFCSGFRMCLNIQHSSSSLAPHLYQHRWRSLAWHPLWYQPWGWRWSDSVTHQVTALSSSIPSHHLGHSFSHLHQQKSGTNTMDLLIHTFPRTTMWTMCHFIFKHFCGMFSKLRSTPR